MPNPTEIACTVARDGELIGRVHAPPAHGWLNAGQDPREEIYGTPYAIEGSPGFEQLPDALRATLDRGGERRAVAEHVTDRHVRGQLLQVLRLYTTDGDAGAQALRWSPVTSIQSRPGSNRFGRRGPDRPVGKRVFQSHTPAVPGESQPRD